VLGAALLAVAHEPDGRVAIRYDWIDAKEGQSSEPKLRLRLTAVVDLSELTLSAKVPSGIRLAVRAEDRAAAPWPDDGIPIGALAAGGSIIIELDVEKPTSGGGIVAFALAGLEKGVPIQEGVGVPVGSPGIQPTLRSGALEFPAEQRTPAP
jgi:hypothetical protein